MVPRKPGDSICPFSAEFTWKVRRKTIWWHSFGMENALNREMYALLTFCWCRSSLCGRTGKSNVKEDRTWGFDGFWWVSMGFDGFRWVSMGFDGFRWVSMGLQYNGSKWDCFRNLVWKRKWISTWFCFIGKRWRLHFRSTPRGLRHESCLGGLFWDALV